MPVRELCQSDFAEDQGIRQQAGHQGWSIDDDGWFRRLRRPGEPDVGRLGFMTDTEVYVSSCEDALLYDQGSQ